MLADRLPVTDQGIVIPKAWLGDAKEVTLRRENGHLIVKDSATEPSVDTSKAVSSDLRTSIWDWGKDPIDDEITDGSVNHDKYIYGDPHRLNG